MCLASCRRAGTGLALILVLGAAAPAATLPLVREDGGTVAEAIDGATLRLDDGAIVRLAGIDAPAPPPGRMVRGSWPRQAEARTALADLALGKAVVLAYGATREDRHGRRLAHVYLADEGKAGLWLQGEMLSRGLARVHTTDDSRALAAEMLLAERTARAARRGLWAERVYRVRTPDEAAADADSFQLVEGTVLAAAVVSGRGYLNYGPDRRTDFTVVVPSRARRLLREAGLDFTALAGRRLRVRGWIMLRDGPMIELTHPEAIELVEER